MVANLSIGKSEFDSMYGQLCQISMQAQEIKDLLVDAVDADTKAFDSVLTGMRMPKDSEEERKIRAIAIEDGYKRATLVPLETAKTCLSAMELANEMADLADSTMMSDVGTGCLMAETGLRSAIYNVRINLPNISDQTFQEDVGGQIINLLSSCERFRDTVNEKVEATLSL
jgi:glutamate formiminotransferase/formiminotetrahydrofolate cyclodeaminase